MKRIVLPDATLGGYLEKHSRPPAFEASDGHAYSVEVYVVEPDDRPERFAAALLFVRWSDDGAQPAGHVETDFLHFGDKRSEVKAGLLALPLTEVKDHLERALAGRAEFPDW